MVRYKRKYRPDLGCAGCLAIIMACVCLIIAKDYPLLVLAGLTTLLILFLLYLFRDKPTTDYKNIDLLEIAGNDLKNLSPQGFERYVAQLYRGLGYAVHVSGKVNTPDQGVDIHARRGNEHIVIQCKFHKKRVGTPAVQQLLGAVVSHRATRGALAALEFTEGAWAMAEQNQVDLIDLEGLTILHEHVTKKK